MPTRRTKIQCSKKPAGLPSDYLAFLESIKDRIRSSQVQAALSVNRELVRLYWDIGGAILEKQHVEGCGARVIDCLVDDLQRAFPGLAGFSRTNIYRMRAFYMAYPGTTSIVPRAVGRLDLKPDARRAIVPQAGGQLHEPPHPVCELPWRHKILIIECLSDSAQRVWYAQQTITNGWSRSMLEYWIETMRDESRRHSVADCRGVQYAA